ncbi:helix-turn-helix domain-containing protein [Streptomyces clavuligerus]|nr:helix-turn-helix domain-containing protein [Streptomyces clavuligerus]WDN50722.1 tetratricopeptide repeat protein [Streptomyces clavuligerus]
MSFNLKRKVELFAMDDPINFGSELRRRRKEAQMSISEMARRVHYSKGYLSRVETGKASGSPALAQACDRELCADGELAELVPGEQDETSALLAPDALNGLPPVTGHFIGRSKELNYIAAFVNEYVGGNVCLINGMAGVGKTALALRGIWNAAESFPDGCLFLNLGGDARDGRGVTPHAALDALLRLLGVAGECIPPGFDARANLYRSVVQGKKIMIFLDNAYNAAQVIPLLPAEQKCRVIVTSRNRLHALDDAMHLPMDVLAEEEAITLFRSVGGHRADCADRDTATRIVAHCGGLPLAIRIAAARFRGNLAWTPRELEGLLADERTRLGVLDDGERSVAAALTVSCRALTGEQRRLFALLTLYPGLEMSVGSVTALAGVDPLSARSLIDRLSDAHLVTYVTADRISLHDLVREFARSRVLPGVSQPAQDASVQRLLDHALLWIGESNALLTPQRYRLPHSAAEPLAHQKFAGRQFALDWIAVEWTGLVRMCHLAAVRGLHSRCWQLAFALREYFFLNKLWDPWIETHLVAVDAARVSKHRQGLAISLNNLGIGYVDRGNLTAAVERYQEAMQIFRELNDERGIIDTLCNLAWVELYRGSPEEALRGLHVALSHYRRLGNARNVAITLRGIALTESELDLYVDAVHHAKQAREVFRTLDLCLDVVMSTNCIAWAYFRAGNHEAAAFYYDLGAVQAERFGSSYERARALVGLGNVYAASGRHSEAAEQWARADKILSPLSPVMVGEARLRLEWTTAST